MDISGDAIGLQILPDGSLIGRFEVNGNWLRLASGAESWCTIPSEILQTSFPAAETAQVIGERLWWIEDANQGTPPNNKTPSIQSVDWQALVCD
jgi:hypothetical protein